MRPPPQPSPVGTGEGVRASVPATISHAMSSAPSLPTDDRNLVTDFLSDHFDLDELKALADD